MNDQKGAPLLSVTLPKAKTLTTDRGYDSAAFRNALNNKRDHSLYSATKAQNPPLGEARLATPPPLFRSETFTRPSLAGLLYALLNRG